MKPLNKRINKKKSSKVTLKNHRHGHVQKYTEEVKEAADGASEIRPEDIKLHQHYY